MLSGSFRPSDQVCVLRSYIRQRDNLIRSSCVHVQRIQKALTEMNLQLHKVISDITGVTGLAILRAIVAGERNPSALADLKHGRIRRSKTEIAAALTGDYREEHVFVLRTHLYRISGVDFTRIDGLGVLTVQTILSEVGLDPKRFPTVKHFTSWLGLCPGSRITGGKVKSSQTRHVVNRAANAFRMGAQCLRNSPTALGAFYRRLRSRLGAPKAITATAHKLARLFYRLWKTAGEYTDPGANYYEQQYQQRMLKNLSKKAQELGFSLVPQHSMAEDVS